MAKTVKTVKKMTHEEMEELRRNFSYPQAVQLLDLGRVGDDGRFHIPLPPYLVQDGQSNEIAVHPGRAVEELMLRARPSLAGKSTITQ